MKKPFVFGSRTLDLSSPVVMGILNVTPDSFSDGGHFISRDRALRRASEMLDDGAVIIDVGGESTRPGAAEVSVDEELDRVIPAIEAIAENTNAIISVDTSKPQIMAAAVKAGAGMINDVRALQLHGALEAATELQVAICLMHMQGQPQNMQNSPQYQDITGDIMGFLSARVSACIEAGIAKKLLIIDPGFGFGKTVEQNYTLLRELDRFADMGLPVLAGLSRKSMIGAVIERPPEDRLAASVALALIAAQNGASIIRVHDVAATCDALKMLAMCKEPLIKSD